MSKNKIIPALLPLLLFLSACGNSNGNHDTLWTGASAWFLGIFIFIVLFVVYRHYSKKG